MDKEPLMNLALYTILALPLWGVLFYLYFVLRRASLPRESLAAKCAASFLAVASAVLALCRGGGNPFAHPAFWFFALCTVADALLEIRFVPGMLVFGGAHVCLVVWLWGAAPVSPWSLAVWAAAYLCAAGLFRKELPTLGKLTVPFCLYPALLGASLALGVALPFTAGKAYWPLAVGTLCFFVSDMMVAKGELAGLPDFWQKPIMVLYWAALYLIAVPLWA